PRPHGGNQRSVGREREHAGPGRGRGLARTLGILPRAGKPAGSRQRLLQCRRLSGSLLVNSLNPEQRAAVHWIGSPLLVLAGAGSGKTGVITRKMAWLVRECGLSPEQITAVTFTNKAAREMKQRVRQWL